MENKKKTIKILMILVFVFAIIAMIIKLGIENNPWTTLVYVRGKSISGNRYVVYGSNEDGNNVVYPIMKNHILKSGYDCEELYDYISPGFTYQLSVVGKSNPQIKDAIMVSDYD